MLIFKSIKYACASKNNMHLKSKTCMKNMKIETLLFIYNNDQLKFNNVACSQLYGLFNMKFECCHQQKIN